MVNHLELLQCIKNSIVVILIKRREKKLKIHCIIQRHKILHTKIFFLIMKHTEETLSKHLKVRKIIDPKTVICICGKKVRLDRNYDPDLLDRHVKNKICKSNDGNSQITQIFFNSKFGNS